MNRVATVAILSSVAVPLLYQVAHFGHASSLPFAPAKSRAMPANSEKLDAAAELGRRADSPTDVCFRWSQQSAVVNGSLYLYGGQAITEPGQTENTWSNDFLVLDLTKSWAIASPPLTGLSQPSGPPAVSNGYLWNSHESLYLYGGEFSWKPPVSPVPFALWEYDISATNWIGHDSPETSTGASAPDNAQPVQRAAEGAGANVVGLGRGFYFGGHLDGYTTSGWSQSIAREYLQSLLEFTFPGFSNSQVSSLQNGETAGSDGAYRNITQGGLQASAGFTARADGLLIYVPGFGAQGVLLALAGGTNETLTQMNNVDVYDIATSSWYIQSTSGPTPDTRVDPCAVIAAAADGSSYNIYMFGGQSLQPAGNQTQYNEMWILTLPSFTWIQVDQSGQSVPYGRSGHTCNVWNAQMIVVGGYVGNELSCESPGIYVYDLSQLQWVQQYSALSAGPDSSKSSTTSSSSGGAFNSTGSNNPFNQQPAQLYNATNAGGLEGSYGYQVPDAVISVVGGGPTGGATVTLPAVTETSGPLATGQAVTYSVSQTPTPGAAVSSAGFQGKNGSSPNIAAIVIGVICGILLIAVCYLAFCAYIYRKQLQLYKRHVAMSQAELQRPQAEPQKFSGLYTSQSTNSPSQTAIDRRAGQSLLDVSQRARRDSSGSSVDDLLAGQEPTFVGVMLNPRRSLRVINQD